MAQYWEVYFSDGSVITSDQRKPEELPRGEVVMILQPGAHDRVGWKDRLQNTNHVFFRTDLDCWTEHDEASVWPLKQVEKYAHLISCYRQGEYIGHFPVIRKKALERYEELVS